MSINTEDRESVRRRFTLITRTPTGYLWQCSHCGLTRTYATETGAYTRISEHLLQKHRVRLFLPSTKPEVGR
jgi:hypothetical protein